MNCHLLNQKIHPESLSAKSPSITSVVKYLGARAAWLEPMFEEK